MSAVMTVVEQLFEEIRKWTCTDDPLRMQLESDVQIWLQKEQVQLNKAWLDGAVTEQNDAAKEQEKINYDKIMALGFTEDVQHDPVYEAEHGFSYCIITKQLTKKIYLDWEKDTKLCKMVRLSNPKTGEITAELPIRNLEHLKEMIDFLSNDKEQMKSGECWGNIDINKTKQY